MPAQTVFHSSGGFDFLGLRHPQAGVTEIVYDDGARRRLVWRVTGPASDGAIGEALRVAVNQTRVVPALYAELKKRAIAIEAVSR